MESRRASSCDVILREELCLSIISSQSSSSEETDSCVGDGDGGV